MEVSKQNIIDLRKIKPEIKKDPIPYSFETSKAKAKIRPVPVLVAGIIGIGLIVYFTASNNYLASFLFFLMAITVVFGALNRKPNRVKCTLKTDGLQINNAFYPWEQLKSFWIFYDPPRHQELSIKTKSAFTPYMKIPLGDEDPIKIRELLVAYIPEKKQEEGLPDVLARLVGL